MIQHYLMSLLISMFCDISFLLSPKRPLGTSFGQPPLFVSSPMTKTKLWQKIVTFFTFNEHLPSIKENFDTYFATSWWTRAEKCRFAGVRQCAAPSRRQNRTSKSKIYDPTLTLNLSAAFLRQNNKFLPNLLYKRRLGRYIGVIK